MLRRAIATLRESLGPHLDLSNKRVETLALIVVAMVSARTVNLSHLAAERPGSAQVASTYRRLQRFFQYVRLGRDWAAPLVAELAGLRGSGSWYLALDRTQWRIGSREVNFLVLAAVTRRFRVPLMWTLIRGRGNSGTHQRIALMRRYLGLFGASSIRLLLADREFIGHAWIDFLCENNTPFAIRLRGDLRITTAEGHELTLDARLHWRRRTKVLTGWLGTGTGRGRHALSFTAKRLETGEWLIVATNARPRFALDAYAKRWAIECLFGPLARTSGARDLTRRCQDPWPQPQGHPPHRSPQARPSDGPRRAGHRLGRARPPRHPMAKAEVRRIPRKILVPNRLRPDQKPPQIRPNQGNRPLVQNRNKTPSNPQSRVV